MLRPHSLILHLLSYVKTLPHSSYAGIIISLSCCYRQYSLCYVTKTTVKFTRMHKHIQQALHESKILIFSHNGTNGTQYITLKPHVLPPKSVLLWV